jgi:PIN domain nuclease of toxin-antitoxin system
MPIIKRLSKHSVLLDTHIIIWLFNGDKCLSPAFLRAIERARERDAVLIASISVWEIAMLATRERIELPLDPVEYIEEILDQPGTNLVPLSPRIATQSCRLPKPMLHKDPADRILVATAQEHSAVLVTVDKQLLNAGKNHYLTVHNPLTKLA